MANFPNLAARDVHIWRIQLSGQAQAIHSLRALLSPEELRRADNFHFERHRRSFTAAHAAMRQILSGYLNLAPRRLVFHYGEQGKPQLGPECGSNHIRFNLSHSGVFGLLAVAAELAVGVDIERLDAEFVGEDVAEHFFSRGEVIALRGVPANSKVDAFFSCWTRKEAYIKALGGGLSIPLDSFDVAFGPDVPAALLRVPDTADSKQWNLYDIPVPHGYKAAVVVEGEKHNLRQWHWAGE